MTEVEKSLNDIAVLLKETRLPLTSMEEYETENSEKVCNDNHIFLIFYYVSWCYVHHGPNVILLHLQVLLNLQEAETACPKLPVP